jgi:hypothetical protein
MQLLQTSRFAGCTGIKQCVLVVTALLFIAGPASASSIIDVEGATLGCFGAGCGVFTSPAVSNPTYGLTFTGSPFDVMTDGTGSASNIGLGTLGRGNINTSSSTPPLSFTLQVAFTVPTGIDGGQADTFSALITGTSPGGGGPLDVDFDNTWQVLTFTNGLGSGSFEFSITNDPEVTKNTVTNPVSILGAIRNATFTPNEEEDPVTAPEPATLVLFGAGLGLAAYRKRRCARA